KMWAEFEELGDVYLNGSIKDRVAGNLNISFSGIDGEELLLSICQRVALSTGSACASGGFGHSRVLSELGVNSELRQATLRIGIGRFNTLSDIEEAFMLIAREVKRQRGQGEKL
ncbi:MAG TPA: aminotransferase class V-fold PLP-dependent enzyme, partial [Myxococcota bacterium]|nr:aminotransferase class V-fold PLP-dependent enzyme [Myxococcota bacterium]